VKTYGEDIVHAFMKILDKCTGEVGGSNPLDRAKFDKIIKYAILHEYSSLTLLVKTVVIVKRCLIFRHFLDMTILV